MGLAVGVSVDGLSVGTDDDGWSVGVLLDGLADGIYVLGATHTLKPPWSLILISPYDVISSRRPVALVGATVVGATVGAELELLELDSFLVSFLIKLSAIAAAMLFTIASTVLFTSTEGAPEDGVMVGNPVVGTIVGKCVLGRGLVGTSVGTAVVGTSVG